MSMCWENSYSAMPHGVPVHSKVLKPKDVQKADGPAGVLHFLGGGLVNSCVDLVHNPHEEPPVDPLGGHSIRQPRPVSPGLYLLLGFKPELSPTAASLQANLISSNTFHISVKQSVLLQKPPPLPGRRPAECSHFLIHLRLSHQLGISPGVQHKVGNRRGTEQMAKGEPNQPLVRVCSGDTKRPTHRQHKYLKQGTQF